MIRYNGIYVAAEVAQAITGADVLIELQVPAGTCIEILEAWVSADQGTSPLDEGLTFEIYGNDVAATGGTALTEQATQGGDAASNVVALGGATIGATPTVLIPDINHTQNGSNRLALPEARVRVFGAATIDNVGTRFTTAPSASGTFSYGIMYGELTG